MDRLVECVPNFSEGRRAEIIERLARAIEEIVGAVVLDLHTDADHNRSVITFVAEADGVVEAALRAVRLASELIDLRGHQGEHPRVGAIVVGARPFLIAYNVNLQTYDVALALKIACSVRGSDGGFRSLKGTGF